MKQGLISLIPQTYEEPLLIDNWRPVTLLNVVYKLLALIFAAHLKSCLNYNIIVKTQNGFMNNRHISSNIKLSLDLIDYLDNIFCLNIFI